MKRLIGFFAIAAIGTLYFACSGPGGEVESSTMAALSRPLLWGAQPRTLKYRMVFTDHFATTPESEVHTWTFDWPGNGTVKARLDLANQPAAWQATYTFDSAALVVADSQHSNYVHRDLTFFRLPGNGAQVINPPADDAYVGLTEQNQWTTAILSDTPTAIGFSQTQSWAIPKTSGLLRYYTGAPFFMTQTAAQARINALPNGFTPYYKVASASYNVADSALQSLSGDMILYTDGGYAGNLATDSRRTHLDITRIQ
jgi:hypothetical protein